MKKIFLFQVSNQSQPLPAMRQVHYCSYKLFMGQVKYGVQPEPLQSSIKSQNEDQYDNIECKTLSDNK